MERTVAGHLCFESNLSLVIVMLSVVTGVARSCMFHLEGYFHDVHEL